MSLKHSEMADQLFQALLRLNSVDECYELFEDLCTVKEVKDIAQRLEVACLLDQGKNYQMIEEETGVSSATISRINRCFLYGSGGYKKTIDKLKESSRI